VGAGNAGSLILAAPVGPLRPDREERRPARPAARWRGAARTGGRLNGLEAPGTLPGIRSRAPASRTRSLRAVRRSPPRRTNRIQSGGRFIGTREDVALFVGHVDVPCMPAAVAPNGYRASPSADFDRDWMGLVFPAARTRWRLKPRAWHRHGEPPEESRLPQAVFGGAGVAVWTLSMESRLATRSLARQGFCSAIKARCRCEGTGGHSATTPVGLCSRE
jgi:hypothetical protein